MIATRVKKLGGYDVLYDKVRKQMQRRAADKSVGAKGIIEVPEEWIGKKVQVILLEYGDKKVKGAVLQSNKDKKINRIAKEFVKELETIT